MCSTKSICSCMTETRPSTPADQGDPTERDLRLETDLGWPWLRCRWRRVSPPPPPRGARCWLSPCCWPTCSASSCPRSWVWRPAAAGPLHLAAERWARPEASESRRSFLEERGEKAQHSSIFSPAHHSLILSCHVWISLAFCVSALTK